MTTTSNKTQAHRWWAGAALLAASQLAAAHTPYLLPLTFSVSRPHVSLQAGISDELFFVPEGAVRTDFYVVNPAGVRSKLERLTHLKDYTNIEADTPEAKAPKRGSASPRVPTCCSRNRARSFSPGFLARDMNISEVRQSGSEWTPHRAS